MTTTKAKGNAKKGQPKADTTKHVADDPQAIIAQATKAAFRDNDPARAFGHFHAVATTVPVEGLPVFTGRPLVMLANVTAALATLTPALPAVVAEMRRPRLREVFELPALVAALVYASQRVPGAKMSAGEVQAAYDELAPLRAATLAYLNVAACPVVNLVPDERVQPIREGTGKLDGAQDAVAITGVFHDYAAALEHKHPFTAAQLERLGALGATLVQQLRPAGVARTPLARSQEAIERDQFAALVADRYDHLLVLATVAFGKARADAMLPALRSAVFAGPVKAVDDGAVTDTVTTKVG